MKKFTLFSTAIACMVMSSLTSMSAQAAQTPKDIVISPTSGDISTALSKELGTDYVAKSITINLAAGGKYTLSRPIVPSASLIINGAQGAEIDASNLANDRSKSSDDEEEDGANAAFIQM